MAFEIKGRVRGEREVRAMLAAAPEQYRKFLRAWLFDESGRLVGNDGRRGKKRKGFRGILANRRLKGRSGTWSTQVAHLFKGYVFPAEKISDLKLRAGVGLTNPKEIHRALWKLNEGGTITSNKMMPIPIYRNLDAAGFKVGRWGSGSGSMLKIGRSGLFKTLASRNRLGIVRKGSKTLFFDRFQRKKRGSGYLRRGLLFVGQKRINVKKQFTGRYDFEGRFERTLPAALRRGQGVVDRATKKVALK